jgi:hypothetical protein
MLVEEDPFYFQDILIIFTGDIADFQVDCSQATQLR